MNPTYGPECEVQVGEDDAVFDASGRLIYTIKRTPHFDLLHVYLTTGQDFEAPRHRVFGMGLSEISGKSPECRHPGKSGWTCHAVANTVS